MRAILTMTHATLIKWLFLATLIVLVDPGTVSAHSGAMEQPTIPFKKAKSTLRKLETARITNTIAADVWGSAPRIEQCTAFRDDNTIEYSVITKERTINTAKNVYRKIFVGGSLRNPSQSTVTVGGHVYYGSLREPINTNFNGGGTKLSDVSSPPLDFDYYEWLATNIMEGSYSDGYQVIVVSQPKGSCYNMYDFLGSDAQGSNNGKTLIVFTFSNDVCLTKTPDGRQFGPSVLAPFSKVTLTNSGYLDGIVIARRFTTYTSSSEGSEQQLHGNVYRG
mmetsp:Transcript_19385/g.42160  ORF Transcript_19385/g.42160 Transcript_19385/m.42160 type:complete len:278 (+) Transcript_19385:144-977(+)